MYLCCVCARGRRILAVRYVRACVRTCVCVCSEPGPMFIICLRSKDRLRSQSGVRQARREHVLTRSLRRFSCSIRTTSQIPQSNIDPRDLRSLRFLCIYVYTYIDIIIPNPRSKSCGGSEFGSTSIFYIITTCFSKYHLSYESRRTQRDELCSP